MSNYIKFLDLNDFLPNCRENIVEFKCPLCEGILYDPLLDECGHIYCAKCIELAVRCPWSQKLFSESKLSPLPVITGILEKQMVYCKNRMKNCNWTGKLVELLDHLIVCEKQSVICSFDDCNTSVDRELLKRHEEFCEYRIINCPECLIEIPQIKLRDHYDICPMFKLDCPNLCERKIERINMNNHLENECDNKIIDCIYSDVGCNAKFFKKHLPGHLAENQDKHCMFTYNDVINFTNDCEYRLKENKEIENVNNNIIKVGSNLLESINSKMSELVNGK